MRWSLTLFAVAGALAICVVMPSIAQVDNHQEIEFPELGDFEIPVPQVVNLDNGLKIFLLEDHELPLIRLSTRIRTGGVYEPTDKTGLASIMGQVQRTGGTRSLTGDEIDDFLEARAASVETSVGATVGTASMDCLAEDFDDVLPVFVEILRHPDFSQDKIELAKVQANSAISRRNDDINSITSREFPGLVYGPDSPLSAVEEYATIAAIGREDLAAWHAKYYHPNNIYLGVVGDFDAAEMKRKLEAAFGDWQRGADFSEGAIAVPTEDAPGVYFVEKSDVTQANIQLGHLGITYDNPDYFPVVVMNEVLGGGFSARLFSRIRSEQGLAYRVSGRVGAGFSHVGLASFGMSTKSETMAEAVDALFREVRGMITEPASQRELELAKDSLLNSFVFNYASKDQVLGQQMLFTYYGLPLDFLEKYRSNVEKVTTADVQRVAETYLHPDKAKLLVVGKSADFDRPLSTFGEVTELDISIPPPPSTQPEVVATDESRASGSRIVTRMAEAMGGDRFDSLEALRIEDTLLVSMQGQSLQIDKRFLLVLPDRIHVTLRLPMGEQVLVVDGDQGFQSMGTQSQPLPADDVAQQIGDLNLNLLYIARYHDQGGYDLVAAGEGDVDGAACDWVEVSFGETSSRLCVGADGRVLRQTYQSSHPFTGAPGNFEITFSDYRDVEGFLVPHKQVTRIDEVDFATVTRQSIEINPAFDTALFERPAA